MTRPGAASRPASEGLSVLFECAPWTVAIPTSWIKGLLTIDEGRLGTAGGPARGLDPRAPLTQDMILWVGATQWFAAWDFGQMVEREPLANGWMLLQLRHADRDIPLALRVGSCTAVQAIPETVPLPRGLFRARHSAIEGAFSFDPGAGARASIGLLLNLAALWTPRELERSASLLESATPRVERRSHG